MLFRREVAKEQLDVNVNPLEDWMEGALLSRQSRHESAASWEASCSVCWSQTGCQEDERMEINIQCGCWLYLGSSYNFLLLKQAFIHATLP